MDEKTFTDSKHYNENGDLLASRGQVFRQVGWQINGGIYDGVLVRLSSLKLDTIKKTPHGGLTPVYVEVGTD